MSNNTGLDLGHGGVDPGCIGPTGGKEKDIVLDIGLKVKDLLKKYPIPLVLTRETDQTLDPAPRVRKVNELLNSGDLLLSLHVNSCDDPATDGAEVFCSINHAPGSKAHNAATNFLNHVCTYTGINSRGVKKQESATYPGKDYLFIIRETEPTAILIEFGFNSNPARAAKFLDNNYRQLCAVAVARGIVEYWGLTWDPGAAAPQQATITPKPAPAAAPRKTARFTDLQVLLNSILKCGLIVDGIPGPLTKAAAGRIIVRERQQNNAGIVMWIQRRLIDLGYSLPKYGADGDFGSETAYAVNQFQKDKHLWPDYVVGPATWAALLS